MRPIRGYSVVKRQSKPPSNEGQRWRPYRQIPFSPQKHIGVLLQRYNRQISCVTRVDKVRKLASRQIQGHFLGQHKRYKSKQNNHSSCFKIKSKKNDSVDKQSQSFWKAKLHLRQQGIRFMHEQYLEEVKQEILSRYQWSQTEGESNKEQKIISQYNIIYDYRACQLPLSIPL